MGLLSTLISPCSRVHNESIVPRPDPHSFLPSPLAFCIYVNVYLCVIPASEWLDGLLICGFGGGEAGERWEWKDAGVEVREAGQGAR